MCLVRALTGVPHIRLYAHDLLFFLDAAWRVLSGQRPHLDFASAFGPFVCLVPAAGLKVAGLRPDGLGVSEAGLGFLFGVWCFLLLRSRMPRPLAAAGSLAVALLSMAPYALGEMPWLSSHAMVYNRWGYALLSILLFECVPAADREDRPRGEIAAGLSSGAVCAALCFTKASYALVSLGVLALSLLLWRAWGWRRIAGIAAGFAVVSLPVLAYLRFDLAAIAGDLRMAAASRGETFTTAAFVETAFGNIDGNLIWTVMLAAATGLLLAGSNPGRAMLRRPRFWREIAMAVALFGAGSLLLSTNAQRSGFPLAPAFALLMVSRLLSSGTARASRWAPAAAVLGLCLAVPRFVGDTVGLAAAAAGRFLSPGDAVRLDEPRVAGVVLQDYDLAVDWRSNGSELAGYLNDGFALLRAHGQPTDRVFSFDATNPFPYALGWRPPAGGVVQAVFGYTIGDRYHPDADTLFGDATVVLYPKIPASEPDLFARLEQTYRSAVELRFVRVAESERWLLYRRRPS